MMVDEENRVRSSGCLRQRMASRNTAPASPAALTTRAHAPPPRGALRALVATPRRASVSRARPMGHRSRTRPVSFPASFAILATHPPPHPIQHPRRTHRPRRAQPPVTTRLRRRYVRPRQRRHPPKPRRRVQAEADGPQNQDCANRCRHQIRFNASLHALTPPRAQTSDRSSRARHPPRTVTVS